MKTEITLKNVMILREGRSERRGEISYTQTACIACNSTNKTIPLTHEGNVIGRVENIYIDDKERMDYAELYGDIVFTDFEELVTLIDEELLYPASVTAQSAGAHSAFLDSVFFTTRDDCDFEDQEPIDLSELRELVNAIAKTQKSDEGEDVHKGWTDPVRKPYVYAPNMSKEGIANWLSEIVANLRTIDTSRKGLKEMEVCHTKLEAEIKESEAFLAEAIRN